MVPPRIPLPDGLDRPFRVSEGLDKGASRSRLRGADLRQPYWGVRTTDQVDTHTDRARALAVRLPSRAFYVGVTAARLHGIPLPRSTRMDLLHVGVTAGERRFDPAGVRSHALRIRPDELCRVSSVRVTTGPRTWCDLAACGLTKSQLVAAGDFLLWHRSPQATPEELREAVASYGRGRGIRLLEAALPLLSDRADSAPESEFRVWILDAGLPAPEVNAPVFAADRGTFLAKPDLSWPLWRVALEYEGDHHRTDRDQWHHDVERFSRLQEHGWITIRITAADYRDPSRLLMRLSRILTAQSTRLGS